MTKIAIWLLQEYKTVVNLCELSKVCDGLICHEQSDTMYEVTVCCA